MKRILLFKSLIPISLTLFGIEFGSRIIANQPISTSRAKLHKNGLKTNLENSSAIHESWGNIKTNYFFGDFAERISQKDFLNSNNEKKLVNENSCRYLILGDSYSFGWLVDYEEAFPTLIQNHLKKELNKEIEFINSAVSGWGIADYSSYIKIYKNKLEKAHLKGIIVFINFDDPKRAAYSNLYQIKNYGNSFSIEGSNKLFYSNKGRIKRFLSQKFIKDIYNWSQKNLNVSRLLKNLLLNGHIVRDPFGRNLSKSTQSKLNNKFKTSSERIAVVEKALIDLSNISSDIAPLNLIHTGILKSKDYPNHHINEYFFSNKGQNFLASQNMLFDFSTIKEKILLEDNEIIKFDSHPNKLGHLKISKNILASNSKNSLKKFIKLTCQ